MPSSGLLISWAMPAARRPTVVSRSAWKSCRSSSRTRASSAARASSPARRRACCTAKPPSSRRERHHREVQGVGRAVAGPDRLGEADDRRARGCAHESASGPGGRPALGPHRRPRRSHLAARRPRRGARPRGKRPSTTPAASRSWQRAGRSRPRLAQVEERRRLDLGLDRHAAGERARRLAVRQPRGEARPARVDRRALLGPSGSPRPTARARRRGGRRARAAGRRTSARRSAPPRRGCAGRAGARSRRPGAAARPPAGPRRPRRAARSWARPPRNARSERTSESRPSSASRCARDVERRTRGAPRRARPGARRGCPTGRRG